MFGTSLAVRLILAAKAAFYGGWSALTTEGTGFFRVTCLDGVWWIVDPEGNVFLSKGVNHVSYTADVAPTLGYSPYGRVTRTKYGDATSWAQASVERLRNWGFNTIGAWSSSETFTQGMAYTPILNIGSAAGGDWLQGRFPDVFSARFRETADRIARERCAPLRDDPYLLGYFTDNELRWGADWRSDQSLLEDYWSLPPEAEGKRAALRLVAERYGTIQRFNETWGTHYADFESLGAETHLRAVSDTMRRAQWTLLRKTVLRTFSREAILGHLRRIYPSLDTFNERWGTRYASYEDVLNETTESPQAEELGALQSHFLRTVAAEYFRVCAEAIRRYDPNHLILGCRFAGYAPPEVVQSMGDAVDVVSYNNYDFLPPVEKLRQIHEWTGKPILLTEFSFKAMDSGLPNTRGAGKPVATQQERAEHFDQYVTALLDLPFAVSFRIGFTLVTPKGVSTVKIATTVLSSSTTNRGRSSQSG